MDHVREGRTLSESDPPREKNLAGVAPFEVNDSDQEEVDIEWSTKCLCSNRLGEPSGMLAEHLWIWLEEAWDDETPDTTNCLRVDDLVQTAFQYS